LVKEAAMTWKMRLIAGLTAVAALLALALASGADWFD